jgi:hypothetical protein
MKEYDPTIDTLILGRLCRVCGGRTRILRTMACHDCLTNDRLSPEEVASLQKKRQVPGIRPDGKPNARAARDDLKRFLAGEPLKYFSSPHDLWNRYPNRFTQPT